MIAKSPEQTIITVGNTVEYHYSIKITTDCDDFSDQINSRLAISKQDDQTGEFIPTDELMVSDEFVGNKTIDSKILLSVDAPGTYRFSFCADYDNRFEERDEGNNCQ